MGVQSPSTDATHCQEGCAKGPRLQIFEIIQKPVNFQFL